MASNKKKVTEPEEIKKEEEIVANTSDTEVKEDAPEVEIKEETKKSNKKSNKKGPKYPIGSIVYVSKDVEADLNGFNLCISQYKKETYTVEAYDEISGVYKLRHLKLLLSLKEDDIIAPDKRADAQINRLQF